MIKKLTIIWSLLNVCLLAAGALTIAFSFVWRKQDTLLNMVISTMELNAGLALGILLVLTSFFAVPSILQSPNNNSLLIFLNWAVVGDIIAATVVGSIVWFYSLCQRDEFAVSWSGFTDPERVGIENMFSCCGYWNGTAAGLFIPHDLTTATITPFCNDAVFAANQTGCVASIVQFTDPTLEQTFSSMYGYVVILILYGLATTCLINERNLLVRFRKIDAKRGGSGFV
ncbi:tetraspanin [Mrakia frigida]|uniref:tetraspanin n=1 Tax=Mrakia frigida TaxID=29902 RepID=UPI003FCC2234